MSAISNGRRVFRIPQIMCLPREVAVETQSVHRMTKKEKNFIFGRFGKHISKGQIRMLTAGHLDLMERERKGIKFTDPYSGKRYIDGFSSAGSFNVGRGNQEIIRIMENALRTYDMGTFKMISRPKVDFAKKLVSLTAEGLNRVIFAGSGSDAIDAAIKLAMGATKRPEVIAMLKAYHGHSGFSLSVNGKDYYKELFLPLMPGAKFATFGDLASVEKMASNKTAAILLEPIQGEGGIHVADDQYLKGLRELCDRLGIILIFDEVQTGFGRTGKLWAYEHSGVVPDIMCLGKSIGGGIYPNGAIIYRDIDILTGFVESNPQFHVSHNGGSDIGCVISSAVLDYLVKNQVWENAEIMGDKLRNGLKDLMRENPKIINEVRGRGMMIGIEYTREYMGVLMADCLARQGMFAIYSGNAPQVMRFQLPITATEEEVDEALDIIRQAVKTMKMYRLLLEPVSRIPVLRALVDNQDFLISLNVLLRKLEFRK